MKSIYKKVCANPDCGEFFTTENKRQVYCGPLCNSQASYHRRRLGIRRRKLKLHQ